MGSCYLLPDPYDPYGPKGRSLPNILVCEGAAGRIFEVTHDGEIVWEYVSPFYYNTLHFGRTNMMFRACVAPSRFGGVVQEKSDTGGEEKARVRSRLEALGY